MGVTYFIIKQQRKREEIIANERKARLFGGVIIPDNAIAQYDDAVSKAFDDIEKSIDECSTELNEALLRRIERLETSLRERVAEILGKWMIHSKKKPSSPHDIWEELMGTIRGLFDVTIGRIDHYDLVNDGILDERHVRLSLEEAEEWILWKMRVTTEKWKIYE